MGLALRILSRGLRSLEHASFLVGLDCCDMDSCGKIPALLLLLTSPERSAAQVGWRLCGRWSSPRYLKISAKFDFADAYNVLR